MSSPFSMIIKFYKNNGLLGVCLTSISQLRGGTDLLPISHSNLQNSSQTSVSSPEIDHIGQKKQIVEDIIDDDRISDKLKEPYRRFREDPVFDDSRKVRQDRLVRSLIAKSEHPIYSKIKSKLAYIILTPATFAELARLGAYRTLGSVSAPLTIGAVVGFSIPCAVTFSMLEMYAPDKFKFPCKCAKWT